ncbi:MAG: glutathione S-transferase family protein [Rhodospirillales bacterium]|nr:glutathione S-transferase family protein [Rhodospirillales bacterium]
MARQLYELVGADPTRRFSPFCWRARLALAHKGLEAECVPWRFTEKDRLAFARHDKVPILVDGEMIVVESWDIAAYLDRAYPDRPRLIAAPSVRFVAAWADTVLHPALVRLIVSDIPKLLGPADRAYFLQSREARFGKPIAEVTAGREMRLPAFRALLDPLRAVLRTAPFLGGDAPDYADHAVFGAFQWARVVSDFALLEPDDPVAAWRERMLDQYGGLARATPAL